MKAAHGSPPLTRPNRHHSNSSYDRMKAGSGANPHVRRSDKKGIMPPFLRLDSAGEVTTSNRPQRMGHQRTNTCRQGASLGAVTGGNGFLSKLITRMAPQATSHAKLDSPRVQNGFCALDQLLKGRQVSDSVTLTGKPSYAKMARTNVHHRNRYGQWGSMYPDYSFLPQGVFPCHVFEAIQSQRDPTHVYLSTSGQCVLNRSRAMSSLGSSLLEASWKYPADKMNYPPVQKMNVTSSNFSDISRCCDKVCAVEKRTCTCPVNSSNKLRGAQRARGPDGDSVTKPVSQKSDITQDSRKEKQQKEAAVSETQCTISASDVRVSSENQANCNFMTEGMQCAVGLSETGSLNSKEVTREVAAHMVDICDIRNLKEGEKSVEGQCEGAECLEILKEKHFYRPMMDCRESHSFTCQDVQPTLDHEVTFDYAEDEDHHSPENIQACNAEESEEIWKCFMGNQFSLSNLLIAPSKKLPCDEEASEDEPKDEPHAPKPCPAVTERWCKFYSSLPSVDEHHCKVRFECGEGKDEVFEYEKGEEETFTVMELQKTRDLNRQHGKHAARLLQKKCADEEHDEDPTTGKGSDVEDCDWEVQRETANSDSRKQLFDEHTGLVLAEEDSESEDSDSDCEDSDSEEEICANEDDVDDDDFIVFEDE